jgi:hypothetical protein
MTIKARKAAAVMLSELEAESDAIRESISDELQFSTSMILTLTESREEELRALDAEIDKRKARVRKTYAELIRNEERRIALYKAQLKKLDGPDAVDPDFAEVEGADIPVTKTEPSLIGHNSNGAEDKAA